MLTAISASLSRRRWQSRLANHPVESRHLVGHPVEVCRVVEEVHRLPAHPVEVRHVADHSVEVSRLPAHPVEVRHVADHRAEIRHVAGRAAEVCRLADHPVESRHVAGRGAELRHVADHPVELRHVADHPVELRRLSAEMRHLAEHLADFAVKQGSSCLYSLGTASMYSFFLFAFTRQLESPFTCHQIVSNGSLQATRVQSRATATPNGRMRIGEDGGVPERKVHTQSLQ